MSLVKVGSALVLGLELPRGIRSRVYAMTAPRQEGELVIAPGPVTAEEHEAAKAALGALGPLRTIQLVPFTKWLEPFFYASASRKTTPEERGSIADALHELILDMPAEVFTPEARRRVAERSDWLPTPKGIREVMGDDARRIIATYEVLKRLAEPLPAALPAPAPKTPAELEAERLERAAHVDRIMAEHRAALGAAEDRRAQLRDVTMPAQRLEAYRAGNPIIMAARAESAKGEHNGVV